MFSICENQISMPTKKIIKKNTIVKEKMLKTITDQLHAALPTLKEQLGEKKFEKRIKKVVKILVSGIKKTLTKKSGVSTEKLTSAQEKS